MRVYVSAIRARNRKSKRSCLHATCFRASSIASASIHCKTQVYRHTSRDEAARKRVADTSLEKPLATSPSERGQCWRRLHRAPCQRALLTQPLPLGRVVNLSCFRAFVPSEAFGAWSRSREGFLGEGESEGCCRVTAGNILLSEWLWRNLSDVDAFRNSGSCKKGIQ